MGVEAILIKSVQFQPYDRETDALDAGCKIELNPETGELEVTSIKVQLEPSDYRLVH